MENNLWLALNTGITKVSIQANAKVFGDINGLEGSVIEIVDTDQGVVIGTTSGLYSYEYEFGKILKKITPEISRIFSIAKIDNNLIIASPEGLYHLYDGVIERVDSISYRSVTADSEGKMIFASTYQMIKRWILEDNKLRNSAEHAVDDIVAKQMLYDTENNELWAVSLEDEFYLGTLSSKINFKKIASENIDNITDLDLVDDRLFISAVNGLYEYDRTTDSLIITDYFGDHDILNGNQIFRLEEVDENSFWVVADKHLNRLEKDGENWNVINRPFKYLSRFFEPYVVLERDNQDLWLGSDSKIIWLKNSEYNPSITPPVTRISTIFLEKDSLFYGGFGEFDDNIRFSYEQKEFRFEFSNSSYLASALNQYQFQLEGYDDVWSDWRKETRKDYTNLKEGSYTFKVRSKDVFDEIGTEASFAFVILPPWYRTWWAYLLYTFAIAGILYMAYKIRVNQLLRVERIRNDIASDLHDEVSATLSSISYFAEAIQSDKVKKDKDRFVKLIANSAGDAKEKITDIVWAINPEHDDWQAFLSKCRRYASDLLESKNMKYSLKIDEYIPGKLDMQLRQHLWLIFKEMVTNATRHSNARQLDVIMNYEAGQLKLVVQDDGKGIEIDKVKKGNGLVNIQKRVDLIGGDITLKTSDGFGTRWILKVSI
jgi:signal transduction histidine kinase